MKNKKERKKEILDELAELSPRLSQLKQEEEKPAVPAGYFESLPDQLWLRIQAEEQNTSTQPSTAPQSRYASNWLDQLLEQLAWLTWPRN